MAAKQKTLDDLFLHTLKDIYYAEKQILKALPKMAKGAESGELKAAFQTHREQTQGQIERLEQIFELLGKPARGVPCEAIKGIIDEGTEIMEDFADSPALDAGILSAAQAVEHYEITRYGTLKTWAQELGLDRGRDAARSDPPGGEGNRRPPHPAGRGSGQPEGGVGVARREGAVDRHAEGRFPRELAFRVSWPGGMVLSQIRNRGEKAADASCRPHAASR